MTDAVAAPEYITLTDVYCQKCGRHRDWQQVDIEDGVPAYAAICPVHPELAMGEPNDNPFTRGWRVRRFREWLAWVLLHRPESMAGIGRISACNVDDCRGAAFYDITREFSDKAERDAYAREHNTGTSGPYDGRYGVFLLVCRRHRGEIPGAKVSTIGFW